MPLDFNDNLESFPESLDKDKNAKVNELLPLDDDRLIETDENGEEIVIDDEVVEEVDPATIVTKHNFVTSPWTKLGIVGGFFALGFGIVFLTMNSLMSGGPKQLAEVEEETPPPAPLEDKNDGEVYAKLALQKQQNDLKNLNGKEEAEVEGNELVGEEDSTNKIDKTSQTKTSLKKEVPAPQKSQPVKATPPPRRRTAAATTNRRASAPPRRSPQQTRQPPQRTTRRATPPATRTARRATPRPTPPPTPVKIPKVTLPPESSVEDKVAVDPLADIERLRNLSSFGRIDYGDKINKTIVASNNIPQVPTPSESDSYVSPETLDSRRRRGYEEEISEPEADNYEESNENYYEGDNNEIQQLKPKWEPTAIAEISNYNNFPRQSQSVPTAINKFNKFDNDNIQQLQPEWDYVPTKAERLRNALSRTREIEFVNTQYLSEESRILEEQQIQPEQYLMVGSTIKARLITPLIIAENNPNQNLRFIAQITEPIKSNTGEIAIPDNTQVVITINNVDSGGGMDASVTSILKNGTEYPITPGTIDVLGKNGNPLIARRYKGGSNRLLGNDIALSTISGIAKVGEVINERDETIEDLPLGGTRTRTSGSRRDIPGALIEGAFGSLSTDIRTRTRKRTDEMMDRPRIWRVKKGKKITIRVNRSIKL